MNDFEIVTVIECSPAKVFAALADVVNAPAWTPSLTEVRRSTDDPLAVGSTMTYGGTFLGRSYESDAQITTFELNRRLGSVTTAGPFHLEEEYQLEPAGAGTKLTTRCRGESHGFFKLAEPVVVRLARRNFESAAENLKALPEGDAL